MSDTAADIFVFIAVCTQLLEHTLQKFVHFTTNLKVLQLYIKLKNTHTLPKAPKIVPLYYKFQSTHTFPQVPKVLSLDHTL